MKLIDVCDFIVDCPHTTATDEGVGYPLIRTPNIGRGRLILDGAHRVSKDVYEKRNKRGVPTAGDLILAREAPAGNVAVIQEGQLVCLGQRTVLIRPQKDVVDSNYLAYYLLAPEQQYNLLGSANGATVAHVNMSIIRNLDINLPPIDIQRKIGKIISAYDDLIENNHKQIKLLEEAAQRLYKEWFIDLHFPGHEDCKIVDGVPEGWSRKTLSDCGQIITGKTPSTAKESNYGGNIPFVKIPDMNGCIYISKTALNLSKSGAESQKNKYVPKNSLMVSCIGTAGIVGISSTKCQTNQQINSIICYDGKSLYYLYFFLKSLKEYLNALGSNGATMTNVNRSKFSNIELTLPSCAILDLFHRTVYPMFEKIRTLEHSFFLAKEARDRLLPKLMSGEIKL